MSENPVQDRGLERTIAGLQSVREGLNCSLGGNQCWGLLVIVGESVEAGSCCRLVLHSGSQMLEMCGTAIAFPLFLLQVKSSPIYMSGEKTVLAISLLEHLIAFP